MLPDGAIPDAARCGRILVDVPDDPGRCQMLAATDTNTNAKNKSNTNANTNANANHTTNANIIPLPTHNQNQEQYIFRVLPKVITDV